MKSALLRLAVLAMIFLIPPPPAQADASALARVLQRVVRIGARVDDVPVTAIERRVARAPEVPRLPDSPAVLRALRAADPAAAREVERLAPADANLALRMFRGAEVLESAHPDRLVRARMLREGGGDLVLAAERNGDEIAQSAARLMAAQEVGQLPAGSLARFSTAASGEAGEQFLSAWNRHIVPNWRKLAAGGAITAFLIEPELFIDSAGNLTEHATATFTRLGVEVAGAAAAGAVRGAAEGVMELTQGPDGIWYKIGFGVIALLILAWVVRRIARLGGLVLAFKRWLFGSSNPAPSQAPTDKRNRLAATSRNSSPENGR